MYYMLDIVTREYPRISQLDRSEILSSLSAPSAEGSKKVYSLCITRV